MTKILKKLNFSHKMLAEIFEQPDVIRDVIKNHLDSSKSKTEFNEFKGKLSKLKAIDKIVILGCGSSYHAGLNGKYMLEEYAGLPCEAELADEFNCRKAIINNKTAIIAISQSGQTAEIVKAVRLAKKQKALIIGITNRNKSKLDQLSDVIIYNGVGDELAVAATKTFTSQLVILAMLTVFLGRLSRKMKIIASKHIIKEIKRIPVKIEKILRLHVNFQIMANKYYKKDNFLIIGKKFNYPIAQEGALKLKEVAYIHAEGLATGELKHGPMAMLDINFPCIFITPVDDAYKENERIIKEVKNLKKKIIAITTQGNRKLIRYTDSTIYVPKTLDLLSGVLSVIPMQLLAYYMAVLRGNNIDKPRHLTKFVG